ncbi:MAG: polyphenol oxidase family protein [Patescibacteria group bacterium]
MAYQLEDLKQYPNLMHGFSTREAGNMSFKWGEEKEVVVNRKKFLEELKLEPSKGVTAELVHSDTILRVGKKQAGQGILKPPTLKADGLITNEPEIYLWHTVADCLSLLFYDPTNKAIGLIHAGWKNTTENIAKKMVEKFIAEFHTKPEKLVVGFGPAINRCCYAYTNPQTAQIPAWQPFLSRGKDNLIHINLVGFNLYQLSETGVEHENIFISEFCTAHSGKFFSHYQDVKDNQPEARFAALIGLK